MRGGGKGAGVRRGEQGPGSLRVPYISVILHGLLQGVAGQLGLRPVAQPAVQGLQVGLHAGAPGEVLQRGERSEETQTLPWEPWGSPPAPPSHWDRHWAAPASSTAACAGGQCGLGNVSVPGPEGQWRVPPMVVRRACSGSEPQPHLREAKSHSDHKSAQSRLAAAL